jgi:hypothetical protein
MKFDNLVESLLMEMPHISFSSNGGKVLDIDLKMEKFQQNYVGFIEHVKNIFLKINDEVIKNDFLKELKLKKHFNLSLNKMFQKNYQSFLNDILS